MQIEYENMIRINYENTNKKINKYRIFNSIMKNFIDVIYTQNNR